MESTLDDRSTARHELVLAGALLVGVARLVDPPGGWLVAGLALAAMLLAGIAVMGDEAHGVPVESLLIPSVLTAGACGAIGLVPPGLGIVPAILVFALVLDRILRLELRLIHQPAGVSAGDRSRVLLAVVAVAFVAFTGVAALVPGGLAEPVIRGTIGGVDAGGGGPPEGWLLGLAAADGLVALLLGYRASAFRYGTVRRAAWSALTYAVVVAIAAGAARAIDLPRLVGPSALALVFYLWDAVHGTAPARRREARFVWELVLLVVLAVVVVAWNLQLRG
jgi:hypothetical protein